MVAIVYVPTYQIAQTDMSLEHSCIKYTQHVCFYSRSLIHDIEQPCQIVRIKSGIYQMQDLSRVSIPSLSISGLDE
jgi:hypothetical protein